MEIILAVVVAIVAGAVVGHLFGKRGVASAEQKCDALQDEVVALQVERGELTSDKKHLEQLLEAEKERASKLAELVAKLEEQLKTM